MKKWILLGIFIMLAMTYNWTQAQVPWSITDGTTTLYDIWELTVSAGTLVDDGDNSATVDTTGSAVEGTAVLSTGESGGTKFLREDGDDTCSWQTPAGAGDLLADASVPMTSDWDIGNYDITLKALTGDGTIEGAIITEGGDAIYSLNEAPTHTVAGNALDIQNTTDATPNQVAVFKSGNRATPANGDAGYICFSCDDDNGTQVEFARQTWFAIDVDNASKDGALRFDVMRDNSLIPLLYLSTNSFLINQDGHDINLTLEGANDTQLFCVDAGLDTITIGSNTSLGKFGIDGDQDEIQLLVQGNGTQTNNLAVFENSAGTDFMTITGAGNVGIGVTAPTSPLHVSGIITTTSNIAGEPKHLIANIFDPLAVQTLDTQVCLMPQTPVALTITKIEVTLDATTNEVAGDLKFADTFIGLGTPTVIETFDTTSGVRSDSAMSGDATVPSGKTIYIQFDSAPDTAITQMIIDVTYDFD